MTAAQREARIAELQAQIRAVRRAGYSTPANARRAFGEPATWPPSDLFPEDVLCPACGWSGPVYFTRGAPPAAIHCPSPGDCRARIPIDGGTTTPIRLAPTESGGWSRV